MKPRRPICLAIAVVLMVAEMAIILYLMGNNKYVPCAVPSDFVFVVFTVIPLCAICNLLGLALSISSLVRHETYRIGAYACLILFILPPIAADFIWQINIHSSAYR
jgi:hypothetical protein